MSQTKHIPCSKDVNARRMFIEVQTVLSRLWTNRLHTPLFFLLDTTAGVFLLLTIARIEGIIITSL